MQSQAGFSTQGQATVTTWNPGPLEFHVATMLYLFSTCTSPINKQESQAQLMTLKVHLAGKPKRALHYLQNHLKNWNGKREVSFIIAFSLSPIAHVFFVISKMPFDFWVAHIFLFFFIKAPLSKFYITQMMFLFLFFIVVPR